MELFGMVDMVAGGILVLSVSVMALAISLEWLVDEARYILRKIK